MPTNTVFRTARGYQLLLRKRKSLTASMEDYLEMIYRHCLPDGFTRVNTLASSLSVQAPSVSRMVQKLTKLGFLNFERYGLIRLSESGWAVGEFLYRRHKIIEEFLRLLGVSKALLTETEIIEHSISLPTLEKIAQLNDFLRANPAIHRQYLDHQPE